MITAGGAGDEGPVLESASPLLPLLWAEDFDGDQSYSVSSLSSTATPAITRGMQWFDDILLSCRSGSALLRGTSGRHCSNTPRTYSESSG